MSDDEKRERRNDAARRWRVDNPERVKQIQRDAYHRRQFKNGAVSSPREHRTEEERKESRREYLRQWRLNRKVFHPEVVETKSSKERAAYHENPEPHRAAARKWYRDHRDEALRASKERQMLAKYGLTLEQFEALGRGCHICGAKRHANGYRLHIDHDHSTGKVRGKLCHGCNTGLGLFQSSPELLRKAAEYLERTMA